MGDQCFNAKFGDGSASQSRVAGKMEVTDAALRTGVLYDLLGRSQHVDMRYVTVEQFMQRYAVDREQATRVGKLAGEFLAQLPKPDVENRSDNIALLQWAANLHEIGLSISRKWQAGRIGIIE